MLFQIRTRMANDHAIGINMHSEVFKTRTKQKNQFLEARRMFSPLPQFLGTTFLLSGVFWVKAVRGEAQDQRNLSYFHLRDK